MVRQQHAAQWNSQAAVVDKHPNVQRPQLVPMSPQYYPPVNGLLMGESYHIIPGTTATSGISLTEDMALSSNFVGHTMAPNHLGPYSQRRSLADCWNAQQR